MKLRVETYCGCCDLHTGTLRVGIGGIILSIVGIITHTSGVQTIDDESTRQEIKVGVAYTYLSIVINALLIYGTIKESRYFLLPWLIYFAIGLAFVTVICVIAMFFYPVVIISVLICAAYWYVWVCVLSYYQQLNPTNPPPLSVSSSVTQLTTMAPSIATYVPQAPEYVDVGKGPQVV